MTGINMSSPTSSSKRIVEGIPAPITFYMDLALNMQEYLEEVMGEAIEEEKQAALKSLQSREAKYKEFGKDFDVSYKDEGFSYTVSGSSAQEATAIEYGPPAKALIRHELIAGADRLSRSVNKHLDKLTGYGKL